MKEKENTGIVKQLASRIGISDKKMQVSVFLRFFVNETL
jgi:hypothetical protein